MKHKTLGILLSACFATVTYAQAPLAFEVASIKPASEASPIDMGGGRMMIRGGGCTGGPGTTSPGQVTCENASLTALITAAYGLKRYQITPTTFPAWMDSTHFDVMAKVPAGATREDVRVMEQNMLKERFHLAVHFDKKEMQAFELIIGKNGPKLKESPPSEESVPAGTPMPLPDKLERDKDGFMIMPRRRGGMTMAMSNGAVRIQADDQTMEQLATLLSNQLAKPVIDATGIKGKYDITLMCSMDSMGFSPTRLAGRAGIEVAPPAADADPAPTLMEAVQQQLGLKLDQKKTMVDVMVVDHSNKTPIEN